MDRRVPLVLPVLKLLLFFVPLFFYVGLDDTYNLPKLVLLYWGSLALLGAWLGAGLRRGELAVARTPLDAPLAAMALLLLTSCYFSWDRGVSLWGQYGHYMFGTVPLLACGVLFKFSATASQETAARRSLLNIILAATVLAAVYAILQYCDRELFARVGANPGGRVWSTFGNPLYLGAYLMMGILIASGLAMAAAPAPRLGYAAIAVLSVTALSLTGSRSAWLGLGVGLMLLAAMGRRFKSERHAVAAALGAPLSMALALILFFPVLRTRIASISQEGLNSPRVSGWISGLEIARAHPFLGTGPDTFVYSFRMYKNSAYHEATGGRSSQAHAHNDLIQWAATTGFIGLGICLWAVFAAVWAGIDAFKRSVEPELEACALAALAALGVQNLFNFSTLSTNATAAVLLGSLLSSEVRAGSLKLAWGLRMRGMLGLCLVLILGCGAVATCRFWGADAAFKLALGDMMVNRGLYAARKMETAVRLNPGVSLYWTRLGNIYRDLARRSPIFEERRHWIDLAVRAAMEDAGRHPMAADNYNNLGVVLMHRGDLLGADHRQEAFGAFRRAVRLDPLCVEAWANLARMAHYFVEPKREESLWRLVLELDPNHSAAREVLGKLDATNPQNAKRNL